MRNITRKLNRTSVLKGDDGQKNYILHHLFIFLAYSFIVSTSLLPYSISRYQGNNSHNEWNVKQLRKSLQKLSALTEI